MTTMEEQLLRVSDLTISLSGQDTSWPVVDCVSFSIGRGETVALVGESGCGKSVTALSLLRLLDPPLHIDGGQIEFEGRDLLGLSPADLRKVRGRQISMVFQEPMTSLNPVLTVGDQVDEVLVLHMKMSRSEARAKTVSLFQEVGIPDPVERADDYPHRLSGGMRQRVMIAMALACDPLLLLADEPTTALDVTIQAQILELLARIQRDRGMSLLLVTHDLGVVAEVAQRVLVMYAGNVVEVQSTTGLFEKPSHPYTRGLLRAIPDVSSPAGHLEPIPGSVPNPQDFPAGCRFHTRCGEEMPRCHTEVPRLLEMGDGGRVACFAREDSVEASTQGRGA